MMIWFRFGQRSKDFLCQKRNNLFLNQAICIYCFTLIPEKLLIVAPAIVKTKDAMKNNLNNQNNIQRSDDRSRTLNWY